ncbi:hypothetical protein [Rhodoblastus acidophilus]|uniref:hypothetical protein n=1 Tax=Rhodoblastus acidophilus TaxID=1074 RepID=UPI000B50A7E6|nr:hypothetical protein [Rhodoblastus acidophilus]PPQ37288.1 hypothetical protein CKO16_15185 [Rhodoblastus acidophilus]RAI16257.1 hypothetical protein CH337_22335 [Rhodoblastus acidophilus]
MTFAQKAEIAIIDLYYARAELSEFSDAESLARALQHIDTAIAALAELTPDKRMGASQKRHAIRNDDLSSLLKLPAPTKPCRRILSRMRTGLRRSS